MWLASPRAGELLARPASPSAGVRAALATRSLPVSLSPARSSILNLPGESTLRRDFLRLQLANKERSEALRRQQLEQQQRENEEHKRQLLAERQKRIEEQKEQRRRLEEVRARWGRRARAHLSATGPPGGAALCRAPTLVGLVAHWEHTLELAKRDEAWALSQAKDFPC